MNFQIERLKRLPQSPHEIWQGGLFKMPIWVQDEKGEPFRPWMAGWISHTTKLIHVTDPREPGELGSDAALTALVEFACDKELAGYRPAVVQVKEPAVADALRPLLADVDIEVALCERLSDIDHVLAIMTEHMPDGPGVPGVLTVEGITVEVMRSLATAAAAFYQAAPWGLLSGDDFLEVESSLADIGLCGAVVLGAGDDTFGLGFFASRDDFESMLANPDPEEMLKSRRWSLFFECVEAIPPADADLWEDHKLPLAGPHAYPVLIRMEPENKVSRPGVEMVAFCEGLLQALALTSEEQVDSGRWCKQVETVKGPVEFTLSLPDLLASHEPPPVSVPSEGVAFNPMMMEKLSQGLERALEGHDFADEGEMKAFLAENMDTLFEPAESATPSEQAQRLVYQAHEVVGRKQLQLIRQALEIWPDCADAYVLQAERALDPAKALDSYTQAMEAAERTLGRDVFEEDAGHFWGLVETRPYMRARFGVAQCLNHLGRFDEASAHYQGLLVLNPNDNQGVREALMVCLLRLNRHDELDKLLKAYKGDKGLAMWNYARALLTFRTKGKTPTARNHLRKAFEDNDLVPDYLLEALPFPAVYPSGYTPGSEEEAILCAGSLLGAWHETPGAVEWLDKAFQRF